MCKLLLKLHVFVSTRLGSRDGRRTSHLGMGCRIWTPHEMEVSNCTVKQEAWAENYQERKQEKRTVLKTFVHGSCF